MTDPITTASATSQPRSPRTIAVDNFLRKTLRVGDPRNPDQVANALLQMYPSEAERVRREADGLAYATWAEPLAPSVQAGATAMAELAQAQDDLDRDARALIESSQLKDIRVELTGWGRTIRRIADDGLAAARLALDATQFDRAMAARAQLGQYARLARYLGTLTDGAMLLFRRVAQSCDTLAALILVAIGEGLAGSGVTRGTTLVRVAAGELQSRRNAVMTAFRSLTGSVEAALGQEEWPRGLEAYRLLSERLAETGQADLRALLDETALAQAMDELIDLAAGANVEGLRELSTASALLVGRFRRLIDYGGSTEADDSGGYPGFPESPPLTAFTSALQLFVDAFNVSGGSRLLYIARPAIVVYGLYGASGPDAGAQRLIELTMRRGALAERLDCFAGCGCDAAALRCQLLLDFILYSLDRATDAYAVGFERDGNGDPEKRAAALALIIDEVLTLQEGSGAAICNISDLPLLRDALELTSKTIRAPLDPLPANWTGGEKAILARELQMTFQAETQVERLVGSLSPSCRQSAIFEFANKESLVKSVLRSAFAHVGGNIDIARKVDIPATPATALSSVAFNRPFHQSRA